MELPVARTNRTGPGPPIWQRWSLPAVAAHRDAAILGRIREAVRTRLVAGSDPAADGTRPAG